MIRRGGPGKQLARGFPDRGQGRSVLVEASLLMAVVLAGQCVMASLVERPVPDEVGELCCRAVPPTEVARPQSGDREVLATIVCVAASDRPAAHTCATAARAHPNTFPAFVGTAAALVCRRPTTWGKGAVTWWGGPVSGGRAGAQPASRARVGGAPDPPVPGCRSRAGTVLGGTPLEMSGSGRVVEPGSRPRSALPTRKSASG
ncbi:hypothetical protein GCM10010446_24810 [Streptomyces enissocaesilis]|uniref:Secreted protein n=1 Tax=Streptomyces enissocaesilis TaxID=332589 RepID=A0ABP6JMY1_9ACTN